MINEQQRSPIFHLDKLKKHLYNTIWGIKQLLMGDNTYRLDQKAQILRFPPKQCNPPLLWRCRARRNHVIPLYEPGVSIIGELGLCQDRATDTHLAQPLGRRRQTRSPSAPDVPRSDKEGPATLRQRGRRRGRHRYRCSVN